MRRLLPLVLMLAASPAWAGGWRTAARVLWAPFQYVGGRVGDLFDIIDVNVGIGPGAKIGVKYAVNTLGAGSSEAVCLGVRDGGPDAWTESTEVHGYFPFNLLGWPASVASRVLDDEELTRLLIDAALAGGIGTETIQREEIIDIGGEVVQDMLRMWRGTRWGDSLPIGAEIHGGIVGARVIVKPLQAIDFALGFVFIDLDPWLAKRVY
ncbi:hypothetical protein HQ560_17940 [bacterium]|nr:hypothetical protein [bacterium]